MDHSLSECVAGFLHEYRTVKQFPEGMLDVCRKCRTAKFFRNDMPDHLFLSHNLRMAIQMDHPRYHKEHAKR